MRVLGALIVLAGCSMVWMIPELFYQGLRAQRVDAPVPVMHPALVSDRRAPAAEGGRIVWLLFDELSYDQTFDHRFPGLAMPAFDKFRSESVVFSDLKPAGYYTDRVIPSFFLGTPVDNIRSTLDGEPQVKLAGSRRWQAFDAHATLFSDAQRLGWTTGVVGWYNPYCRILAGTLNYCFWRMGDGQSDGALPDHSVWQNAMAPLVESGAELESRARLRRAKAYAGSCRDHAPGRGVDSRPEYQFCLHSSAACLILLVRMTEITGAAPAPTSITWRLPTSRWENC